jgi:asparaginyl-tRNA synthetase
MSDQSDATVQIPAQEYLESKGIPFKAMTFPVETEKGALGVARALSNLVSPRQVVKTLIFEMSSGENVLVMVGGDQNVISGSLKKALGDRNVKMASQDRVHNVTGYQVGSIPPFSWQPPGFRSIIDKSLMKEEILAVGTGFWGNEILLTPADLQRASSGEVANLTGDISEERAPASTAVPTSPVDHPLATPAPRKAGPTIEISKLRSHIGEEVSVGGWLSNERSSGGMLFLELRDGSGFVQAAVEKSAVSDECWSASQKLTRESSCILRGSIREDKRAPGGVELKVSDVQPLQLAEPYPIGRKEYGPEFLFNHRHLHVRSKLPWAILRIRDEVFHGFAEFLRNEGYLRTDTPVLQPTHCEDSTQLFEVDYFGDPMYLSQSGQLYLETIMHGLGKVYDFGPVFRAEQSKTRKHLCEFWMLDWETPFADQDAAEDLLEAMVKYVLTAVLENRKFELELLKRDLTALNRARESSFIKIELRDAITLLNEKCGFPLAESDDLSADAEEKLGDYFGVPVFVKNYPYAKKAFYMKRYRDPRGTERAVCADLIAPEGAGEIATCAVREESYENLLRNLNERGQSPDEYSWYLDVRRYGSVPHAGGGIGPERIVRWITGVHHIRETIPFPRTLVRRTP